ncbi:storkhead-box protein 1 isoform X3 [Mus caroli]|uniref:Storkhead-box protein 1 isoform X3 n=1 Tax=Mus caroli TaxID=10089 RepID=A0A6P7RBH9_MUSCR|nr:storkhead-box protein 1 isoform X3 [Mus caroli]
MARPVQLAPGSLALVLSPREAGQAAGEPGGRALFRAFRRANARCFWNARLARAASRLAFLGWLRRGVLLVRAPQPCVQVLRDAWRRRALRPPRGFRITAVGDVFPVQMSPIAQCRFVPLAEVLCCAIADMNAVQMAVTQQSLLEHLIKHYPGRRAWYLLILTFWMDLKEDSIFCPTVKVFRRAKTLHRIPCFN